MKYITALAIFGSLSLAGCQQTHSDNSSAVAENSPENKYQDCDAKWDSVSRNLGEGESAAVGVVYAGYNSEANMELFRRNLVGPKTDVVDGKCGVRFVGEGVVDGNTASVNVFCPLDDAIIENRVVNGVTKKVVKEFKHSCQ